MISPLRSFQDDKGDAVLLEGLNTKEHQFVAGALFMLNRIKFYC